MASAPTLSELRRWKNNRLVIEPAEYAGKYAVCAKKHPPKAMKADDKSPYGIVASAMIPYSYVVMAFDEFSGFERVQPQPFLGIFLIAYILIAMYLRIQHAQHNARAFEILWGCNMAMLQAGVGCIIGAPVIISAALGIVALDQTIWYIDIAGYLLTGQFPIGAASYITFPEISFVRKITTLHHLWFLPLGFYALRHSHYHSTSYVYGNILATLLVILCRLVTPCNVWLPMTKDIQNIIGTKNNKHSDIIVSEDGQWWMENFNINLGFQFWLSVKISFLHICDDMSPVIYIPYLSIICVTLQFVPFILLRGISHLLFGM